MSRRRVNFEETGQDVASRSAEGTATCRRDAYIEGACTKTEAGEALVS